MIPNTVIDCLYGSSDATSPKVCLANGRLVGRARETRNGTEFVSFTRIPYGQPPVGRLRFRRPVPAAPWSQVLHATKKCSKPLSINKFSPFGSSVVGSEDCLHLNVYTPDLPITENQPKLPVMVWIYGGEFFMGDASEDFYFPEHLMDSSCCVIVTFNYRQGPFGFLCLGTEEVPGNQGLWDQILALQWVQANVAAFGGDPDRVTLVGEGTGSVCVSLHLVSRASAGLFHRAICMSGSFATPAYYPDKCPEVIGRAFADRIGATRDSENPLTILRRLQEKTGDQIVRESTFLRDWDLFTPKIWLPCVDKDYTEEPFLADHPFELVAKGDVNKMPILMGRTRDEGVFYMASFLQNSDLWRHLRRNWNLVGAMILLNKNADEFDEKHDSDVMQKIRDFYLITGKEGNNGGGKMYNLVESSSDDFETLPAKVKSLYATDDDVFCKENAASVSQMFGDAFCFGGNEVMINMIKSTSAQHLFTYSFEYEGGFRVADLVAAPSRARFSKIVMNRIGVKGHQHHPHLLPHHHHHHHHEEGNESHKWVCHLDDHFYFFSSRHPLMSKATLSGGGDQEASDKLVKLWTNFAKTGNPTPGGNDPLLKGLTWTPDQLNGRTYLQISSSGFKMQKFNDDLTLRSKFWRRLISEVMQRKRSLSRKAPQVHEKTRIEL